MKKNVHGEGNYEATRDYNSRTKKFIDSGRVDAAAKAAAPRSPAEAKEMKHAEESALLRAKGDDAAAGPAIDVVHADPAGTVDVQRKAGTAAPKRTRR
ncbi:MAG: hypothetical protein ABI537_03135 [Casimicrobiaceae bacterium]